MGYFRGVNAAQRYTYLKNSGCGAIRDHFCQGENFGKGEFCTSADLGGSHCYTNKLGKADCYSNLFTDQCNYKSPTFGGLCTLNTDDNNKNFSFEDYGPH